MESLPLVDSFTDRGYRTVGVTSNIYFSRGQGFDAGFDEFYETRRPLNPHGLNPFSAVREREPPEGPEFDTYLRVLGDALAHDRPIASIENYLRAVAIELDRRYDYRDRLPRFDADEYGFLTEGSDRSETLLLELFERHQDADRPFFAFANFMDTHYPYQPPERYLAAETDGEYTVDDLRCIDPDISNSWTFFNQYYGDGIDEADLELVRAAYRAEVRCVDDRVGRLLDDLEHRGLRDETLVVVTSDHGEVLGERDPRGERSMGHLDSLSEHLRTVPLIVAGPDVDPASIERPVPLHALTSRLLEEGTDWIESDRSVADAVPDREPVLFELPANPYHETSYEKYGNIPDWYARREAKTHTVAGIRDGWLVAVESSGTITAWRDDDEHDPTDAPQDLLESCKNAVASFPDDDSASGRDGLSEDLQQQLESLGYM